jgi:hypothetical protein
MLRESVTLPMPSNRPVPIESRALGTLSYIRASIDAASALAVPGTAGIILGIVGGVAALLANVPMFRAHWLALWLGAACIAFVLAGALMAKQASQRGNPLFSGAFRKFLLCLGPSLLGGAVLTLILWQAELERAIPGMWLLLYGCAVIPASTVTTSTNLRLIAAMGAAFIVLGAITFWLPSNVHTLMLGLGFGGLHLLVGILIGRANHGD